MLFKSIGHWAHAQGFVNTRFVPKTSPLGTYVGRAFNPDVRLSSFPTKVMFEARYGVGSWDRKSTGIGESWASDNYAALIFHPSNPFQLEDPAGISQQVRTSGPGQHELYYDLGLVYGGGVSLQSRVLDMIRSLGIGAQPPVTPPVQPPVNPPVTPPVTPPITPVTPPVVPPITPVNNDGDALLTWVLSLTLRQLAAQVLLWGRNLYRSLTK